MSSGRWTCDVIILHSLEGQQSDLSLMTHCLVSLFSVFGGPIRCRSCHGLYCSRGLDGRLGETVVRFHGLLPRLTKTSPGWTEQNSGRGILQRLILWCHGQVKPEHKTGIHFILTSAKCVLEQSPFLTSDRISTNCIWIIVGKASHGKQNENVFSALAAVSHTAESQKQSLLHELMMEAAVSPEIGQIAVSHRRQAP
jgi:hypothetical protein